MRPAASRAHRQRVRLHLFIHKPLAYIHTYVHVHTLTQIIRIPHIVGLSAHLNNLNASMGRTQPVAERHDAGQQVPKAAAGGLPGLKPTRHRRR